MDVIVIAVVITHNRLALLQQSLAAIRKQSRSVDGILVINNGSADGTAEWLARQADLTIVSQSNLGSSGGQFSGIKVAHEQGYDWFWCMDDDTVPEPSALEKMCRCVEFTQPDTGFLSSLVKWNDGNLHLMNRPRISAHSDWIDHVLITRTIPVITSSFVSILVSRRAVEECGLPLKEMFIWGDDTEFTRRITRKLRGYVCLESTVLHATEKNIADSLATLTKGSLWKFRYGHRNGAYLLAMGDGPMRLKLWQLLRRIGVLFRELHALDKLAFLSPLLSALLTGFFSFRPTIVYPTKKSKAVPIQSG